MSISVPKGDIVDAIKNNSNCYKYKKVGIKK